MLGLGIDTGGTCTDAVIYDFDTGKIVCSGKAQTTRSDLEIGIANAIDTLDQDLVRRVERVALSTTLATNACLENKGARAKLLMLGFYPDLLDHLKEIYASYGLDDMSRFILMDAKVEGLYSNPFDPDWEMLRREAAGWFSDCDSVGVVQKHPRANGGRFELTARKILREETCLPVTIAYDISNETDILKTCAGTLLNARLIPLLAEFIEAVHRVLHRRGLDVPVSIVRSDGTMMPERMAHMYPVETILCGPAASTVGGHALAGEENAIVVDMGGTTTDIAVVRKGLPVLAQDGIRIGQWKTMVQGLYVDTIGLGGDSAIRYTDREMYLDTERVIPLSVLAAAWDHVVSFLENLTSQEPYSMVPAYEFFVLLKDISGVEGYSQYEQALCRELQEKPLIIRELAGRMGKYPKLLGTQRLERDGVIIRSGLTPTDMMILKGDFTMYPPLAARAALRSLAVNTELEEESIPDIIYEKVCRRLYDTLGRVILQQQYPGRKDQLTPEYLQLMLDCCYEQAKARLHLQEQGKHEAHGQQETQAERKIQGSRGAKSGGPRQTEEPHPGILSLTTGYPLVGVGAPVHVFLPRVGALLGTKVIIPEHAGVANALGAVACQKTVHEQIVIHAVYEKAVYAGMEFSHTGKRCFFEEIEEAVASARKVLLEAVHEEAALREMPEPLDIKVSREDYRAGHTKSGILLEITLRAEAT